MVIFCQEDRISRVFAFTWRMMWGERERERNQGPRDVIFLEISIPSTEISFSLDFVLLSSEIKLPQGFLNRYFKCIRTPLSGSLVVEKDERGSEEEMNKNSGEDDEERRRKILWKNFTETSLYSQVIKWEKGSKRSIDKEIAMIIEEAELFFFFSSFFWCCWGDFLTFNLSFFTFAFFLSSFCLGSLFFLPSLSRSGSDTNTSSWPLMRMMLIPLINLNLGPDSKSSREKLLTACWELSLSLKWYSSPSSFIIPSSSGYLHHHFFSESESQGSLIIMIPLFLKN